MMQEVCDVFTELCVKIKITCSVVPSAQDIQMTRSTLRGCPCSPHLGEAPLLLCQLLLLICFSLALPDYPSPNSSLSWPIIPCNCLLHPLNLDGNHMCLCPTSRYPCWGVHLTCDPGSLGCTWLSLQLPGWKGEGMPGSPALGDPGATPEHCSPVPKGHLSGHK